MLGSGVRWTWCIGVVYDYTVMCLNTVYILYVPVADVAVYYACASTYRAVVKCERRSDKPHQCFTVFGCVRVRGVECVGGILL